MDASSSATVHSRAKALEDYANPEEIDAEIDIITHENFILSQTVEVLERYLRKRSPALLVGMEKFIESYTTRGSLATHRTSLGVQLASRSASISSSKSTPSPGDTLGRTSTTSSGARGVAMAMVSRSNAQSSTGSYKISPTAKADIVERELEENRMTMEKLQRKFTSAQFLLQTEEENMRINIHVLAERKKALEDFLSQNTDEKTGRVNYEKFVRLLEKELDMGDLSLRKIKLKTKSLHTEYKRFNNQQQQRLELMERLHPIDIEKLLIENQEQLDFLEEKNVKFEDLKKVVGKKGQTLVTVKSRLNDTNDYLSDLKQDLKLKDRKCKYIEEQQSKNQNMLTIAEETNKKFKTLNAQFKSPDVYSYLQVESKLHELKLEKESWARRCKYQKQQISLLEHQLKQLSPIPRSRAESYKGRATAPSIIPLIIPSDRPRSVN